jgi:type IV secretory pathway VirB2 component (pilin)
MSISKTKLFFGLGIAIIAGFFSFTVAPTQAAACEVLNARFALDVGQTEVGVGDIVNVLVDTEDCEGEKVTVQIRHGRAQTYTASNINLSTLVPELTQLEQMFQIPVGTEPRIKIRLKAGESACSPPIGTSADVVHCSFLINTMGATSNASLWNSTQNPGYVGSKIEYNCVDDDGNTDGNSCNQQWEHLGTTYASFTTPGDLNEVGGEEFDVCQISSVAISPSGDQGDDWYFDADSTEGTKKPVRIDIQTENCAENIMTISLIERDNVGFSQNKKIEPLKDASVTIDENERVRIELKPGETACDSGQCRYSVEAAVPGGSLSIGNLDEQLRYSCDGNCSEAWELVSVEPSFNSSNLGITIGGGSVTPLVGGECQDADCSLLFPLPGFEEIEEDPSIGKYVNIVVQILIGFATLLAVIMIVVGGVQYMTTDALGGKQNARSTIMNAVLGLLLAFGSYIILATINPDILRIDFDTGGPVTIVYEGGPAVLNADGTFSLEAGGEAITVNGVVMRNGDPWPQFATQAGLVNIRPDLVGMGYTINNNECATVGSAGCTSLYFQPAVASQLLQRLTTMRNDSSLANRTLRITGGSEFWLHKTHHPDAAVLDFGVVHTQGFGAQDEAALNSFIIGNPVFPGECQNRTPVGSSSSLLSLAKDEDRNTCSWNPAPHWHVIFR